MSLMDRTKWKRHKNKEKKKCDKKIRYRTRDYAKLKALTLEATLDRYVTPYLCPWCDGWHLTKLDKE